MADGPGDDQWINEMLASALSEAPEGDASTIPLVDVPPPQHRVTEPAPAAEPTPVPAASVEPAIQPPLDSVPLESATVASGEPTTAMPPVAASFTAPEAIGTDTIGAHTMLADTRVGDDPERLSTEDDVAEDHDDGGVDGGVAGDVAKSAVAGIIEWVVVLVGAVVVALLLRAFLFQAFWIPSESMESTLLKQDRVLVNKLSYRLHDVNRGDVVVFRRPDDEQAEIRDLIKRVIGLPGETVSARDNTIFIDDRPLIEPYLADDEVINDFGPVLVPDGEFFVMGDNRDRSLDSRFFGTVAEERITGRAFVLFWPLNRIDSL